MHLMLQLLLLLMLLRLPDTCEEYYTIYWLFSIIINGLLLLASSESQRALLI
jgi:hypothetical protein